MVDVLLMLSASLSGNRKSALSIFSDTQSAMYDWQIHCGGGAVSISRLISLEFHMVVWQKSAYLFLICLENGIPSL